MSKRKSVIITISLDIKKSVEICDNLWTKNSVDKGMLNNKIMEDKYMTQENKSRLIKFL